MKQGETINDPANYAKMSEPFESKDKANQALQAFADEVSAARKRHGIANVIIIIKDSCLYDGEPGDFLNLMQLGSSQEHEAMAAYAFGAIQAERRANINRILRDASKT